MASNPIKVTVRSGLTVKVGRGPQGASGVTTAAAVHAATSKTTPVDADETMLVDSAATYGLKKLTFANLKVWVKSILGGAAQLNVGTTAGTVAAGDDARIIAGGTAKQPGTTLAHYGITDARRVETKTTSFAAAVGGEYDSTGVLTVVGDPTTRVSGSALQEGDSYTVRVVSGDISFGYHGENHTPSSIPVRRSFLGSTWRTSTLENSGAQRALEYKTSLFTAEVGGAYVVSGQAVLVSPPTSRPDGSVLRDGDSFVFWAINGGVMFSVTMQACMTSLYPYRVVYSGGAWYIPAPYFSAALDFAASAKAATLTNLGGGAAGVSVFWAATQAAAQTAIGIVTLTPAAYSALVVAGTVNSTTLYLVSE